MSRRSFRVWGDNGDEAGAGVYLSHAPQYAAERFAERHWEALGCPSWIRVFVREIATDCRWTFGVVIEPTVRFDAKPLGT